MRCRKGYSRLYLCMWHLSLHTGTKDRNIFLIDHFKCKNHPYINVLRLSWHLFFKRWKYFGFYSHIVMKGFDFSEKRTSTIFKWMLRWCETMKCIGYLRHIFFRRITSATTRTNSVTLKMEGVGVFETSKHFFSTWCWIPKTTVIGSTSQLLLRLSDNDRPVALGDFGLQLNIPCNMFVYFCLFICLFGV